MGMDIFDLVFLLCAVAFNWLIVGIFIATKQARPKWRQTFGVAFVLLGIPFTLVFVRYMLQGRSWQTMLPFAVVLIYIAIELFLDYILKFDFRRQLITHIPYIVLEYLAMFSLIGISFSIDQLWGWIVSISFWTVMGSLIYLYRDKGKPSVHLSR